MTKPRYELSIIDWKAGIFKKICEDRPYTLVVNLEKMDIKCCNTIGNFSVTGDIEAYLSSVNTPKVKKSGWVNICIDLQEEDEDNMFYIGDRAYETKQKADENADKTRIACVEISWEE